MVSIPKFIEEKIPQIQELCKQHHIDELRLFGSMAENRFTDKSDIDFLYEFQQEAYDKEIAYDHFMDLWDGLEELFNRDIDLVYKAGLKPRIKDRTLNDSIILYTYENRD